MKKLFILLSVGVSGTLKAQKHTLEKLWETDTILAVPESVLPIQKKNMLYVSLIDGGGWEADGKGGVGKLSTDGKIEDLDWITGLQAPKGLGLVGNKLYVADITEVIVVNTDKGVIQKRIAIDSAKGLNDITINENGIVFVSDSRTAKIWRIENDRPSLFLDSVKGVNGLKAVGADLLIAAGKKLIKADAAKQLTPIADLPQGVDGIEPVGNGDYLVTAWSGYIFYVTANGEVETLLETYPIKKNAADLGYNRQSQVLYVPTFNGKTVAAYRLK